MSAHDIWNTPSMPSMPRMRNKKIALLISVLALFLAFSETLGKSAQTAAITDNVDRQRPVGVLPGQDHPHDRAATPPPSRCRSRPTAPPIRRSRRGWQDDRRLEEDRRALR